MALPKKILTRKDEITRDFFILLEKHIDDLLNNRSEILFHARHFAALLFIHPVHLTNTIKLTTGKSPCDFMEERIFAEAAKMLEETEMPVKDIGYIFAYTDPTNFTKFFKGMCGTTPLRFRKNARTAPVPEY